MLADEEALRQGALNLLLGCAGARAGETLLILEEDAALGYYGADLAHVIAKVAQSIGVRTSVLDVPFSEAADMLTPELERAIRGADHTLFLARLGDQLRFRAMPPGARPIVSYVLDTAALASPFGSASYAGFVALKQAFHELFAGAGEIRITCARGTDVRGCLTQPPQLDQVRQPADVSIKRYPVSVFAPLDAAGFAGKVAVAHLMVGTGSRYYQPYGIPLASTLIAHIAGGRLMRWEGDPLDCSRAAAHYEHVAGLFGIDKDVVHSWHAGIHPGCAYLQSAHDHYERWSGSAFGNPRLLHFHTCGAYAPGEICWNVVDPTICVDSVDIWRDGRIMIAHVPGAQAVIDHDPQLRDLFDNPSSAIGLC